MNEIHGFQLQPAMDNISICGLSADNTVIIGKNMESARNLVEIAPN